MNVWNVELKVPAWLAAMVAVLIVALALGTYHYQAVYQATDKSLMALEGSVKQALQLGRCRLVRLRDYSSHLTRYAG